MKKLLKGIKSFVSFVFFAIYFVFALVMTVLLLNFNDHGVTVFGENSLILIDSKISNETYKKGDLVIAQYLKLEEYKEGDYVFVYKVGSDRVATINFGKIGEVHLEDEIITLENGENYSPEFIAGVPTNKIEKVGAVLSIIESKWGFLFIILVPVFLIFIYEVYSLIIEIKYGKDED